MSEQDFDLEDEEGTESAETSAPPPVDKSEKRINDLMSKWQKAEARAVAAEARLSVVESPPDDDEEEEASPSEPSGWLRVARENAISQVYKADPRFERYGITQEFFDGADPDSLRDVASELSALINTVEARMRDDMRAEYGFVPELGGAPVSERPRDFARMPADEFEALIRAGKSGTLGR